MYKIFYSHELINKYAKKIISKFLIVQQIVCWIHMIQKILMKYFNLIINIKTSNNVF